MNANVNILSFETKERKTRIQNKPAHLKETTVSYNKDNHKRSFGAVKVVFGKVGEVC